MTPPLSFVAFGAPDCGVLLLLVFLVTLLAVLLATRLRRNSTPTSHDGRQRLPARTGSRPELVRHCPECGGSLPADAPEGLCPQCLLKGVISSAYDAVKSAPAEATAAYAGPTTAPTVAELTPLFPQLEILELIGQGGMGAVFKARQPSLDRLIAVKVLPPEAGKDPAFAERFNREARALARLSHPNIVAVHDVGKAGDFYYFVMEYVDGANLRQVLRDGQLTPEQALRIVPQICDALQYAHEEGVVHRDIKPENILLDRKGRVKIADFGLAKLLGRDTGDFTLTGSRQVMGTLYYMAPEQVERPLEVDHRADIYSLGVVFYEMLTGQLPVGRFPMPSERAGTDAFLDEVVLHALEREPERRYQHASDVKTDVQRGKGVVSPTRPDYPKPPVNSVSADLRSRVQRPAVALMVTAIINWAGALLAGPWFGEMATRIVGKYTDVVYFGSWILGSLSLILPSLLLFYGGLQMKRLESRRLALLATALAFLIPPAYPIGWPVAVWAFVVLTDPEVKAAFARRGSS
jgi:predicted Ser/Thr protein kinase